MKKILAFIFCLFIVFSSVSAAFSGSSSVTETSNDLNGSEVREKVDSAEGVIDRIVAAVESAVNTVLG